MQHRSDGCFALPYTDWFCADSRLRSLCFSFLPFLTGDGVFSAGKTFLFSSRTFSRLVVFMNISPSGFYQESGF
jgi:hypothetical protein